MCVRFLNIVDNAIGRTDTVLRPTRIRIMLLPLLPVANLGGGGARGLKHSPFRVLNFFLVLKTQISRIQSDVLNCSVIECN